MAEHVGRTVALRLGRQIDDKINCEMGGPLALGGRHLIGVHNNQIKVGVDVGGWGGEETRLGRNLWGVLSFCAGRRIEGE